MTPKEILKTYRHYVVIGVTENKEKYGYKIYQRLKDIHKDVYGVSPIYKEIEGDKVYTSVLEVEKVSPIDVVVFVVSPKYGKEYLGQMRECGIQYAWLQPGTYDETFLELVEGLGMTPVTDCVLVQSADM